MSDGRVVLYVGGTESYVSELQAGARWQVEHVETVDAAVSQLGVVDCLVTEQDFPEQDGLALCRRVRDEYPSLPVVFVPESGSDRLARDAVAADVDEYLPMGTLEETGELSEAVARAVETGDREQRRYRKLIEQSMDVVLVIDPDGQIRYISPAVERTLGYEAAALVGEDAFSLVHPADRDEIREAFATGLERPEEQMTREYRVEHADGSLRWMEARAQNFLEEPSIGGIVVSARDITDRKERANLYSTLVEEANAGIVITQDDQIQFVNDQMATLLGGDTDDIEGRDALEFVAPADREFVAREHRARIDSDETTSRYEIELQTVTGDRVPVEVSTSLVSYRGGVGELAVIRDITARQERERELGLYETMLNAVPDMVYAVDEDGTFVAVNETMADLTGYAEDEILGSHVSLGMSDEDVRTGQEHIMALLTDDDREKAIYEMEMHTADGDALPVENHIALLTDADGTYRGSVGVLRDVSDRKRRERRLTVLNRALRHDLRNSMHVILANAELVERTVSDPDIETRVATIQRRAEEISSLSEKAREIEETIGERTRPRKPVDLAELLTAQTTWFREQYPDATIDTDIPDHAWVEAIELVDVAVENLIENSIQHTTDQHVEVSVEVDDETVTVRVSDTGPGIPEKERRIVSQGSETPLDHASGLGLWLVAWITRDSGGQVVFEDSAAGSVVQLVFERADRDAEQGSSAGTEAE